MKPLWVMVSHHTVSSTIRNNFDHHEDLTVAIRILTWGHSSWDILKGEVVPTIYIEDRAAVYLSHEQRQLIKEQEAKGAKITWIR